MKNSPICLKIGSNIRRLRKHRSQAVIAEQAGIAHSYLSLIERGHKDIGIVLLERIAQALSVQPSELFKDPPTPPNL